MTFCAASNANGVAFVLMVNTDIRFCVLRVMWIIKTKKT